MRPLRYVSIMVFFVSITLAKVPPAVYAQSCSDVGHYIGASCTEYSSEYCLSCAQTNCLLYANGNQSCFEQCFPIATSYC